AFFSLEKNIGYRYKIINQTFEEGEDFFKTSQDVEMKEGHWQLETEDSIVGRKIRRVATLRCLEDSIFMDFVVRFRFKASLFPTAKIQEKEIQHERSNVYHQYPVKLASLYGSGKEITIQVIDAECSEKLVPYLYVRDHQEEWVVHARMLPNCSDKTVIKLCSKYFRTSPLPIWLSSSLLKISKLKEYLWYRSEHSPYTNKIARIFSLNAFPMVILKKGTVLKWVVEVEIP
ncbi:MAG: hypothetical protein ACXVLQ_17900, partial [Bacteriovorax sp.]